MSSGLIFTIICNYFKRYKYSFMFMNTMKAISHDIAKTLSPLEKDILSEVEQDKKFSAADIYRTLSKKRKVAQSSVSVLLDRLFKKGLLQRETETTRGGIRFLYTLDINREKYERKVVENTVNALIQKFGSNAIAYFNESFNTKRKK